jgi:hypothetical protein
MIIRPHAQAAQGLWPWTAVAERPDAGRSPGGAGGYVGIGSVWVPEPVAK